MENALDTPSCASRAGFEPNRGQVKGSIWGALGAPEQATEHQCQVDNFPGTATSPNYFPRTAYG